MPLPFRNNALCPNYLHDESGIESHRIDALPAGIRRFSREAALVFERQVEKTESTCFQGISRTLPPAPTFRWEDVGADPVVALSGGLDSFLVAALYREQAGRFPTGATLVSKLPGYCEAEDTRSMARKLGMRDLLEIEVSEQDFVDALPDAVRAAEIPFYNLHPVSKWLFAIGLRKCGVETCLSGDGADQLCRKTAGVDYLPIVGALLAASGLQLHCPLFDRARIPNEPEPDKQSLRKLARQLLSEEFATLPKRSCYTPAMDLRQYLETPDGWSDQKKTLAVTVELLELSHG